MPSNTLPTGTVSRPQEEHTYPLSENDDSVGSNRPHSTAAHLDYERRIAALEAEIETLETELARRDRDRQHLIDRYERVISDRDRTLSERSHPSSSGESSLLGSIRRRLGL